MPVTRGELREIITLAKQAYPEPGQGRRFLKMEWNGAVAASVSHDRIEGVCPINMIQHEQDGAEKVKAYLKDKIARAKNPGFDPLL